MLAARMLYAVGGSECKALAWTSVITTAWGAQSRGGIRRWTVCATVSHPHPVHHHHHHSLAHHSRMTDGSGSAVQPAVPCVCQGPHRSSRAQRGLLTRSVERQFNPFSSRSALTSSTISTSASRTAATATATGGSGGGGSEHMGGASLIAELKDRGLIFNVTADDMGSILDNTFRPAELGSEGDGVLHTSPAVYCGFDPTARSLHLGNLIAIMALVRCTLHGVRAIFVVGGATGQVGDPSGRSTERIMMDKATLALNLDGITSTIDRIVSNARAATIHRGPDAKGTVHPHPASFEVVDNMSWYTDRGFIQFLAEVGPLFNVKTMLGKHTMKQRFESETESLTFLELTYQVLQAFDFLELYRTRGCVLQIGGSDQWGNITAGCELVRKSANTTVHGLTLPLIVTADGVKFGKSAGNAVWLDADMTSPYHLYQFLVNTADADIEKLLLHLTLLSPAKVADVMVEHSAAPHTRSGQHTLAREIVRLVHGQAHLERAEATSAALFRGDPLNVFDAVELQDLFANAPAVTWPLPGTEAKDEWPTLVDLAVHAGLSGSKKQARRSIAAGGLYVNNVKVETERLLSPTDILHNTVTVLRAGKKNYVVVKWL